MISTAAAGVGAAAGGAAGAAVPLIPGLIGLFKGLKASNGPYAFDVLRAQGKLPPLGQNNMTQAGTVGNKAVDDLLKRLALGIPQLGSTSLPGQPGTPGTGT